MSYKLKGIERAVQLAKRARDQRGGNEKESIAYELGAPDALGLWQKVYLESLATRNYALDTQENRRHTFKLFFAWAAERDLTRASQITRPILESFQRWLWHYTGRGGKPLGWSTQNRHLGNLKHFFRWLSRQNVIVHNPASELEMPRAEKRLPHEVLTQAQVEKLLVVPDVNDPLGVRDRTMLELFYSAGIRRTELCRLDLPDLNAERRTLHVRGKGNKDRVVPVGARALAWLERYLREVRPRLCLDTHTQALFLTGYGEAFNPDVVSRMVSRWLKQAGVPRKGGCHTLRHACATHMLEHGADIRFIQQLLGHANLDTTAIYTEVSIKQLQEVHARCHPAAKLPVAAGEADANGKQAPPANPPSVPGENA
jgi:integrase/recombinase XerD